ncbi:ParB N-terminal domain-containing protein [Streptomyces sp. HNM0575]|uniref:IS701 family transposase n=1 Tax=Streptomyces sp. HNM0575 TaxID=2716338 RepID=UPI00145E6962|nr:transposase [Streptomyces sp. HNM0575]NLU73968.1 ParB N-terminal domain-containing protein [Streptomyces sp. HNM0575]
MHWEQAPATQDDGLREIHEPDDPYAATRTFTIPIRMLRHGENLRAQGESQEYVAALARSPVRLPPIFVHRGTMRILDGMHRLKAAELRGDQSIEVVFFDGDEEDAFVAAVSSNARHGLPLSFEERAAAAARILKSRPHWPDRSVAMVTGLDPRTVRELRVRSGVPDPQPANLVPLERPPRPSVPQRYGDLLGRVPRARPSAPVHQVAREFELEPCTVVDVLNRLRHGRRETPGEHADRTGPGVQDLGTARPGTMPEQPVPEQALPQPVPEHAPEQQPVPDGMPARLRRVGPADATELVLDQVCGELFATLTRRDQRQRARQYLRGLLETSGRKTIRNIAAYVDGPGTDQRLHHFISDSTWDWEPVRTALTRYVARTMEPEAWVIRPVMIPKAGPQAVAVTRRFCPTRGKAVQGQQAVGVLAVSAAASTPVSWRLQVPKEWVKDAHRRARAGMPDDVSAEALGECTAQALLRVLACTGGPDRPAVLDGRDMEPAQLLRPLGAAEVPLLVRIPANLRLLSGDPAPAGHRANGPLTARQIVEAARFRRRPVVCPEPGTERGYMVTSVDVRLPESDGNPHPAMDAPLQLTGVSPIGENVCEELWLTTLRTLPAATVSRLARLVRRVDRDLESVSENVGIWDFSGRSFPGWHRHVTLASVAHLVRLLARTDYRDDLLYHCDSGNSH